MTIIEKVKAEIERRRDSYLKAHGKYGRDADYIAATEDLRLLEFLDTIELEKPMNPEGLEEEIDRFFGIYRKDGKTYAIKDDEECVDWKMDCNPDFEIAFASHFAQWGAEHAKIDVTDFCKPIDPSIAQCIADHSWEMLGEDERPVPEDLEEAAGEYEKKHTYQRYDGGGLTPEYNATLAEAFIAVYNGNNGISIVSC